MVNSTKYLKTKCTSFLILHKFLQGIEEKLYDHFNRCQKSIVTKFTKNIRKMLYLNTCHLQKTYSKYHT